MNEITRIMERASEALNATRYLECERLCIEALELARASGDFDTYARILLPLQEARRIRRQTAVESGIHVLAGERLEAEAILDKHPEGCLLLVAPPYKVSDEAAVRDLARQRELFVEVLATDQEALRRCFESQLEQIGDESVASIDDALEPKHAVDALAAALERVGDHEIAHQRLAEAARRAAREA